MIDVTEETTSELNGPGAPDEWAACLATAAPGPATASILPVLDAEKLSRTGRRPCHAMTAVVIVGSLRAPVSRGWLARWSFC
ncbi:hypothetical protein AB0M05_15415 [Streptomyces violaceusniger]|uniref:hypothetical protein n=1 Tax=Streptomyces violaceusniger TaxID=68280 RepID=UPI00342CBED1